MKKYLILFLIALAGCSTNTPTPTPTAEVTELPRLVEKGKLGPPYVVKTNVLIGVDTRDSILGKPIISQDHLNTLFRVVEMTFGPIEVEFSLNIEYVDSSAFTNQYEFDGRAFKYKDSLVIFFMPDSSCFWETPLSGITSIGLETPNYVIIYPEDGALYALPHEIGHFFGLNHTFPTDGVTDTLDTDDPTYANIMNYSGEPFQTFTPGQFRVMQSSLEGRRNNVLIK